MSNSINAVDAYKMIKSGNAILIDVRSVAEFEAEHIDCAISLPLDVIESEFKNLDIPSDKVILVHCLKGVRGQSGCSIISNLGCCDNQVLNIEGGINAWKEAGLPVVSVGTKECISKPMMSIFRQTQIVIGAFVALGVLLGYVGIEQGFMFAGFIGVAFAVSGITGWCGIGNALAKMPWNK